VFVCAKLTSDFETFAQRLDQQVDAAAPVPESMTDWVTQVGGRIRWYGLGDKWLVVTYDSSSRSIVFSYAKDRPDVFGLGRDVTPPKRVALQDSTGDARRAARQGLKPDAGGVVIVNAVIKKDGTVGDAEILGCLPRRKGLEQAAMNALKSWRYEPATKEGTAVAIALTSAFNYGPNGTTRGSDGSDTSSGGSSGAGSGSPKGGGGF
jgi:TonB family protein